MTPHPEALALRSGRLVALREEHPRYDSPPRPFNPNPQPPPSEELVATSWVVLRLEDEAGDPLPRQPYRLKLADGSFREGISGPDGFVRLENIPKGSCTEEFLGTDAGDWKAACKATLNKIKALQDKKAKRWMDKEEEELRKLIAERDGWRRQYLREKVLKLRADFMRNCDMSGKCSELFSYTLLQCSASEMVDLQNAWDEKRNTAWDKKLVIGAAK